MGHGPVRNIEARNHPLLKGREMSDPTNRAHTPPSITGRRRRFNGAHPYPALPQSRLPLLRGMLWLTWAACLAIVDTVLELVPGTTRSRRRKSNCGASEPTAVPRRPRLPSLTPTG
jgi:hypothetical protein